MKGKLLFLAVEFTSNLVWNNFYFPLYFPDSFRRKRNYMFQFDFHRDFPHWLKKKKIFLLHKISIFVHIDIFDLISNTDELPPEHTTSFAIAFSRNMTSSVFPMPFISSFSCDEMKETLSFRASKIDTYLIPSSK